MSAKLCVLTAARPSRVPLPEDFDAARGVVFGELFGFALWVVLFSLFFLLT